MVQVKVRKIEEVNWRDEVQEKYYSVTIHDGEEFEEIILNDKETRYLLDSEAEEEFDLKCMSLVVEHIDSESEIFYMVDEIIESERNVVINGTTYAFDVLKDIVNPKDED